MVMLEIAPPFTFILALLTAKEASHFISRDEILPFFEHEIHNNVS